MSSLATNFNTNCCLHRDGLASYPPPASPHLTKVCVTYPPLSSPSPTPSPTNTNAHLVFVLLRVADDRRRQLQPVDHQILARKIDAVGPLGRACILRWAIAQAGNDRQGEQYQRESAMLVRARNIREGEQYQTGWSEVSTRVSRVRMQTRWAASDGVFPLLVNQILD